MLRRHTVSLGHAIAGLKWAFVSQPNFRVHLTVSIIVILAGLYFKVSQIEWVILLLCITLGLVIELINTAIESAVDLITTEHRQFAKYAKDTAAASMLLFAFGATVIGLAIFLPKVFV